MIPTKYLITISRPTGRKQWNHQFVFFLQSFSNSFSWNWLKQLPPFLHKSASSAFFIGQGSSHEFYCIACGKCSYVRTYVARDGFETRLLLASYPGPSQRWEGPGYEARLLWDVGQGSVVMKLHCVTFLYCTCRARIALNETHDRLKMTTAKASHQIYVFIVGLNLWQSL